MSFDSTQSVVWVSSQLLHIIILLGICVRRSIQVVDLFKE